MGEPKAGLLLYSTDGVDVQNQAKDSSRHAALVNMLNLVGSQHEMQRVTACTPWLRQGHLQKALTSC